MNTDILGHIIQVVRVTGQDLKDLSQRLVIVDDEGGLVCPLGLHHKK
ncbi:Uncharacterized [Moorella glycerini]|uniref:Uncharacterized protein n=1 Tax=Neomoorella stamsii TaxID=1266720 RepID=A0A9X7J5L3_9FIRM|nr:hypothetical protein [Moorella glycerini]PRR76444.1 hypothetical protein MOST_06120 [Moorella stamsii]CEP66987.1 Uncharacterized [Moorella glycerini]